MDSKRIVIPLANGLQLVAEQNTDPSFDKELFIGITDGNGVWWQDLAVVRNAYTYEGMKLYGKTGNLTFLSTLIKTTKTSRMILPSDFITVVFNYGGVAESVRQRS